MSKLTKQQLQVLWDQYQRPPGIVEKSISIIPLNYHEIISDLEVDHWFSRDLAALRRSQFLVSLCSYDSAIFCLVCLLLLDAGEEI